jgi:hypothetical protein
MATLKKTVTLMDDYGRMVDVDVSIDPSTAFGLFPASLLTSLGVKPFKRLEHRTGRRLGLVEAMLKMSAAYIICSFGEEDCEPLLGYHNLASLVLQINEQGDDLEPLVLMHHEHPRLEIDV